MAHGAAHGAGREAHRKVAAIFSTYTYILYTFNTQMLQVGTPTLDKVQFAFIFSRPLWFLSTAPLPSCLPFGFGWALVKGKGSRTEAPSIWSSNLTLSIEHPR